MSAFQLREYYWWIQATRGCSTALKPRKKLPVLIVTGVWETHHWLLMTPLGKCLLETMFVNRALGSAGFHRLILQIPSVTLCQQKSSFFWADLNTTVLHRMIPTPCSFRVSEFLDQKHRPTFTLARVKWSSYFPSFLDVTLLTTYSCERH